MRKFIYKADSWILKIRQFLFAVSKVRAAVLWRYWTMKWILSVDRNVRFVEYACWLIRPVVVEEGYEEEKVVRPWAWVCVVMRSKYCPCLRRTRKSLSLYSAYNIVTWSRRAIGVSLFVNVTVFLFLIAFSHTCSIFMFFISYLFIPLLVI
jgi:hypothetical protein